MASLALPKERDLIGDFSCDEYECSEDCPSYHDCPVRGLVMAMGTALPSARNIPADGFSVTECSIWLIKYLKNVNTMVKRQNY
jgi:hypothetical protein